MPGPHDPNYTTSTGLAVGDAGAETGNRLSAKEEGMVKAARRPTQFWLGLAALVLGLATLAIVFFFFPGWPDVLVGEGGGAGLALLAICFLLVTGAWRDTASLPLSVAPEATLERPSDTPPAATLPETAPPEPAAPASAVSAPPAAPVIEATPAPADEAVAPTAEQSKASVAASPAAPEAAPQTEAAPTPARKTTRAKTGQAAHNGHSGELPAVRPKRQPSDDEPVPRPSLTALPQSYPRPAGGYALDAEAEDLSQLLGDVAEQTVIALATRGQRGIERRERMASKIDAFSQEMAVDADYAPVVAYLESISALLRAGKPIPAARALVDPFDGLYGYVLTLFRRKTGKTQD